MPFLSNIVVMVPVVTLRSVSIVEVIGSLLFSSRIEAQPFVTAANIGDQRNGQDHHPELADDLAIQEVERTESQP